MSAKLYYDGQVFTIDGGPEQAGKVFGEIRECAADSRGGTVHVPVSGGTLAIVVGPGIAVAVLAEESAGDEGTVPFRIR